MSKNVLILGTNVVYAKKVEYFASTEGASRGFMLRAFNQIKKQISS